MTLQIAFLVNGVPDAFAKAVAAGAVPLSQPKTMSWGATVATSAASKE